MSRIKSSNTNPEKKVRSLLHSLGYRFRLHGKDIPGKPDIVLRRYMTAIFVHGCFWHRHAGCKNASIPKSNTEFWTAKLSQNVQRDKQNQAYADKSIIFKNTLLKKNVLPMIIKERLVRKESLGQSYGFPIII